MTEVTACPCRPLDTRRVARCDVRAREGERVRRQERGAPGNPTPPPTHKHRRHGDAARTPFRELRKFGKTRRVSRNDVPADE